MSELTGEGEDLANKEANILYIDNKPPEELGEGGPAIIFDVPEDLTYDDGDVEAALWNGEQILLYYHPPDWDIDQLVFSTEVRDCQIVVTDYPPGVLTAEEVYETRSDAPHAESLKPVYDWLQNEGIRFADFGE